MQNHDRIADRLLHQAANSADVDLRDQLIRAAQAHATLAAAGHAELRNLIAVLRYADELEHPLAALIIRRQIRRRLGLFPALTDDGTDQNGGE